MLEFIYHSIVGFTPIAVAMWDSGYHTYFNPQDFVDYLEAYVGSR